MQCQLYNSIRLNINISYLHMLYYNIKNYLYNCRAFKSDKYHCQENRDQVNHSNTKYYTCNCHKKHRYSRFFQSSLVASNKHRRQNLMMRGETNNRHPLFHLNIKNLKCMASMYRNQLILVMCKVWINHNSLIRISSNLIMMSSTNRLHYFSKKVNQQAVQCMWQLELSSVRAGRA